MCWMDLPEVMAFKDRVLADVGAVPRYRRATIPLDLREDWPARLAEAGSGRTSRRREWWRVC